VRLVETEDDISCSSYLLTALFAPSVPFQPHRAALLMSCENCITSLSRFWTLLDGELAYVAPTSQWVLGRIVKDPWAMLSLDRPWPWHDLSSMIVAVILVLRQEGVLAPQKWLSGSGTHRLTPCRFEFTTSN